MCFGNSDYRDGETTVVEAVEVQPDIANEVAAEFGQNSSQQKRAKVVDVVAYMLAVAASGLAQGQSPDDAYDLVEQILVNRGIRKSQRTAIIYLAAKEGGRLEQIVNAIEDESPGVLTAAF